MSNLFFDILILCQYSLFTDLISSWSILNVARTYLIRNINYSFNLLT